MSEIVRVGMADYKLCHAPARIITLGLGSCVGVVIYDPKALISGMAHIMLPDSTKISTNHNRKKFADTCLHDMLDELLAEGALVERLRAKIAGGARMFAYDSTNEHLNIGGKNIEAVKAFLNQHKIPVLAEDTGAYCGRTIEFDIETCELKVKAVGKGMYVI